MEGERRSGQLPDTGRRRREGDPVDEFALLRDKILLALGTVIVLSLGFAAVFLQIRNTEVALGVLTVGGTLLGTPAFLRFDESRRNRNGAK